MANVAVVGTGYVGLTTGACLAHLGHTVVCADVDPKKIDMLRRGEMPILEDGLPELVQEGVGAGRLSFVVGGDLAVREAQAEFVFLCVQTPQGADGSADLSWLEGAARDIAPALLPEAVVINKSTVPVGSTLVVERAIGRGDIAVVSNPEFLREGTAVHDSLNPDRIVIGSEDQAAAIRVAALFSKINAPVIVTDPASAETIKYASNAFLATKLSFVNAVANLCEAVGADVRDVIVGMGYDPRIGFEFLKPGPGFGGSCLDPRETVLVERGERVWLTTLVELFASVEETGPEGYSVLAWRSGEARPEFWPVSAFTTRPYDGEMIEVTTKMGRHLRCTADHPFVVGDGLSGDDTTIKLARDLTDEDWLPIAQNAPFPPFDPPFHGEPLSCLGDAGLKPDKVIVRLDALQYSDLLQKIEQVRVPRRYDVKRSGVVRLSEALSLGLDPFDGTYGTAKNGTYVPALVPMDEDFWRVVGLFLAEGHIGFDGQRARIVWSFHPTQENDLAEFVAGYWRSLGVKADIRRVSTTLQVTISSRIVAAWFQHGLRLGKSAYDKRLPDVVWATDERDKRALLRGLWDGDGSWSRVSPGPSVVMEYGTVSPMLADGMLRLLGELGVVARVKTARTRKATTDAFHLCISGAEQIERCLWLFPEHEQIEIRSSIARQRKRIRPTGYRPISKNAAWVRISSVRRYHYSGNVYSLEVPVAHTVVSSGGLVTHNCLPKDTQALVRIAEDSGYDFSLLRGVIEVNDEQFERITDKIAGRPGARMDGKTVAVWGLTFKARTDDMRQSPSLAIIERLRERGAKVRAYDPAVDAGRAEVEGVEVCADPYAACEGADVVAVLTEWDEFRWIDLDKVRDQMAEPRLVDARNLLDSAAVRRRGFSYEGLGRV